MTAGGPNGSSPFNRPRVLGGLALLGVVVFNFVLGHAIEPISLGLILGSALLLLGVEAGKALFK